jgi:signal transduction histidine kinase
LLLRYGLAIASVIVATAVRWLLDPLVGDRIPFLTHFVALVYVAWYGGAGPSLLALVLTWFALALFILPPRGTWMIQGAEYQMGFVRLVISDVALVLIGEAMQAAQRRAAAKAREASEKEESLQVTLATLRASEERYRFLADCGATLAASLDYEHTLQTLARLALPTLADYCVIYLAGENGSIRQVAAAHTDGSREGLLRELGRVYDPAANPVSLIAQAVRTGQPKLIPELTLTTAPVFAAHDLLRRVYHDLAPLSWMIVPLVAHERTLGVISLSMAESGRRYGEADLAFAQELARRAALAIDNARLYSAVQEADRHKDEFLAMLAHELRNPLAPIRNANQVLRLIGPPEPSLEKARGMIERQVQHLTRLVDDLLDVSRITRGKISLHREPLDLATVVARAAEESRPLLDARGHELTLTLPPEPVPVLGDATRLVQVLANLLTNAAKYTPNGGHVGVTVARKDGEAAARVKDDGVGIAPELLPRVFDLFIQGDRSLARSEGGLGIGLTLVKRLVELHGGTVTVQSDGPGTGSEFTVRLPLLKEEAAGKKDEKGGDSSFVLRPSSLRSRRVLVVDDNLDAAESLAMLLKVEGHEVRTASDGPAALDVAATFRPEVVFLDLGLPRMDGYEVARRLRAQPNAAGVLLVALTGYGQEEDRRRSEEAGFDAHLIKPADPEAVQQLLAQRT